MEALHGREKAHKARRRISLSARQAFLKASRKGFPSPRSPLIFRRGPKSFFSRKGRRIRGISGRSRNRRLAASHFFLRGGLCCPSVPSTRRLGLTGRHWLALHASCRSAASLRAPAAHGFMRRRAAGRCRERSRCSHCGEMLHSSSGRCLEYVEYSVCASLLAVGKLCEAIIHRALWPRTVGPDSGGWSDAAVPGEVCSRSSVMMTSETARGTVRTEQ